MTEHEFSGIFEPVGGSRAVMSHPSPMVASKKLIDEVKQVFNLPDETTEDETRARELADWLANKMERFGASFAEPVIDMEGSGPKCSWCGMIWPLCGHHHMSRVLPDETEEQQK